MQQTYFRRLKCYLTGNNSYSGATRFVSGGATLILAHNSALGTTSDIFMNTAGSTLGFQENIAVSAWTTNVPVDLNNGGTAGKGTIHNFSGNNSFAGNVRMFGGNATWGAEANSSLLVKGIISGGDSRAFTKIGAGTIELEGANTFTGQVRVRQGTLVVRNNSPAGGLDGALGRDTNGTSALRIVQLGDTLVSNVNDDIALLVNGPFTVARNIAVNNTNPTAQTTLGGANTSGTATYSGAITLARDVNLTSAVGGKVDFSGNISGAFDVTVLGGGTVVYTGAKNYTGATNVNDGTLLVNGALSASSAQVIVNDGGTLGGSGTIGTTAATVTIQGGGTLSPGASVGTLNIGTTGTGNNVVFSGTAGNHAIYHVELDGLTDDSDLLVVNGNLDLSGAFDELNVSILGPPPASETHIIATYTGILSGIFDFVPTGYAVNYGTGVNSFISLSAVAIPEPSSLLLLALGAVCLVRRRSVISATAKGMSN